MRPLNGAEITNSSLTKAVKVADLVYFDGPIVSLYRNEQSENLLFCWVDRDDDYQRWLAAKVSDSQLEAYLKREVPLLELIKGPKDQFLYVVDFAELGQPNSVMIVSPKGLPSEYLPAEDSFYDDEPVLSKSAPREERIPIEGDWTFDDLSSFPNLYASIYSLTYFSRKGAPQGAFEKYPMRDGFSSVHFFNAIKEQVPKSDKSQLRALRYASPGAIVFKLDPEVATLVRKIYTHSKEHHGDIGRSYAATHKILHERKLLGADAMNVKLDKKDSDYLVQLGRDFAKELGLEYQSILDRSSGPLMAIKIVLAFYRRLLKFGQFETEGKMRVPVVS
jgi:hypothetical protein